MSEPVTRPRLIAAPVDCHSVILFSLTFTIYVHARHWLFLFLCLFVFHSCFVFVFVLFLFRVCFVFGIVACVLHSAPARPTCRVNGLVVDTSSGWSLEEWQEFLDPLVGAASL